MKKRPDNHKTITINRRAYYNYHVLDSVEAGLVLKGTEIKSIRAGQINISEAYARPQNGELWLMNAHIASYHAGGIYNHEPTRPRKLLLHKDEAASLMGSAARKGLTIIALRVYIKNHVAKVQLGLVRGKREFDKRRAIIDRDKDREARRALRRST